MKYIILPPAIAGGAWNYDYAKELKRSQKRAEYKAYINSKAWKKKRKKVLKFYGNKCFLCDFPKYLEVHHRTYKTIKQESMKDVIPLCRACHEQISFEFKGGRKLTTKETEEKLQRLIERREYTKWLFFEEAESMSY